MGGVDPGAQEGPGQHGGGFPTSQAKGDVKEGVTEHPVLLLQGQVWQVLCGRHLSLAPASWRRRQVREKERSPGQCV